MRKIIKDQKGITAIELLLSFVLISIIMTGLFTMFSAYKNKQQIEGIKENIYTYKNLLSKEINDDLIKKRLISANNSVGTENIDGQVVNTHNLELMFQNGDKKCLSIKSAKGFDFIDEDLKTKFPIADDRNDYFVVAYGECGNMTEYPLPDVGFRKNPNGKIIKDLRINNIIIDTDSNVLNIYIGFYHPDLNNRYSLDIVCPINF